MGLPPETCLPQLKEKFRAGDAEVRARLAPTILVIDSKDEDAQSVLIDEIKSKSMIEADAINVLGRAGPSAAKALPLLRQELKSSDPDVRDAAAEAIERIQMGR